MKGNYCYRYTGELLQWEGLCGREESSGSTQNTTRKSRLYNQGSGWGSVKEKLLKGNIGNKRGFWFQLNQLSKILANLNNVEMNMEVQKSRPTWEESSKEPDRVQSRRESLSELIKRESSNNSIITASSFPPGFSSYLWFYTEKA